MKLKQMIELAFDLVRGLKVKRYISHGGKNLKV